MPRQYPDMAHRIIAHTIMDWDGGLTLGEPCWVWVSATNNVYGVMGSKWLRGPRKGRSRTLLAHREAIPAFTGRRLTKGMVAKHLCNQPLCCNPHHLRGGSQSSNMKQCVAEGRHGNQHRAPVRNGEV